MSVWLLAVGVALAFGVTVILTPVAKWWAEVVGWIDLPNESRKLHRRPIPRVGGIALALGATVGLGYFYLLQDVTGVPVGNRVLLLWGGALTLWLVGLYDDVHGLGFKKKFLVQLLAAYGMIGAGFRLDVAGLPLIGDLSVFHQHWLTLPITLLWIVGVVNAVNLIDGMDGLAAGVVGIALLSLATAFGMNGDVVYLVVALAVVGAIGGFLVYNFNPASIFMGDSGSLFLGFTLALYALSGHGHSDPGLLLLVPLVAVGLPVLDTSLTFLRRIVNGQSPFMPDSDHIHHRVFRVTQDHRQSVLVLYGIAVLFGATAVLISHGSGLRAGLLVLVCGGVLYIFLRRLGYGTLKAALVRRVRVARALRQRERIQQRLLKQQAARLGARLQEEMEAEPVEA